MHAATQTTSIEAYRDHRSAGKSAAQRARILNFIKARGGDWSIGEIAKALELEKSTVSARINELLKETKEVVERLDDFRERNPDRPVIAPLIDAGLSKDDCKAMIQRAGIALPVMYLMGYDNANCIGCVKGGEGYWRAIREDFPEYFEAICLLQDEIGEGSWFLRYRSGPKIGQRFPLRDLPAGEPRRNEALPSCSFFCEMAESEYAA